MRGARARQGGARRNRCPGRDDGGFSLVEMMVALMVAGIVVPLAYGIVRNLLQQSTNTRATMAALEEHQIAEGPLIEDLHAAQVVLGTSSATNLAVTIEDGYSSTTATSGTATLDAELLPAASASGTATFQVTVQPTGGQASTIGTYNVAGSPDPFGYWYVDPTTGQLTETSDPSKELAEIVAVSIDVQFLAGSHGSTGLYTGSVPSTLATTIYLVNATQDPAPSTSTGLSFSGSGVAGTPQTVTATVTPAATGGTVTFTATGPSGYMTTSPAEAVSGGTATWQLTPPSTGTYEVQASYTGDTSLEPSQSPSEALAAEQASSTSLALSSTSPQPGQSLTATATVSPSGATGTVTLQFLQDGSSPLQSCTLTVTAASPAASCTYQVPWWRSQGMSISVEADYAGSSTYAGSTASATATVG